eukprot:COSAG01_NODE_1346_length_10632_cov_6.413842_4_plen_123_part_00
MRCNGRGQEERHRINMEKSQQEGRTPLYWVNQSSKGRWHHQEDIDPHSVEFAAIQRLVDATFDASAVGCGWAGYTTAKPPPPTMGPPSPSGGGGSGGAAITPAGTAGAAAAAAAGVVGGADG